LKQLQSVADGQTDGRLCDSQDALSISAVARKKFSNDAENNAEVIRKLQMK